MCSSPTTTHGLPILGTLEINIFIIIFFPSTPRAPGRAQQCCFFFLSPIRAYYYCSAALTTRRRGPPGRHGRSNKSRRAYAHPAVVVGDLSVSFESAVSRTTSCKSDFQLVRFFFDISRLSFDCGSREANLIF